MGFPVFEDNDIDPDLTPDHTDLDIDTHQLSCLLKDSNYNLSTLCLNIRSLKKNFNELCIFLRNLKAPIDVIGITETWLDGNTNLNSLNLPNYNIFHKDRADGFGGVLLYIHNRFMADQISVSTITGCEDLWVKLNNGDSCIYVNIIYKPPNCNIPIFLDELTSSLHSFHNLHKPNNSSVILLGDYNIDFTMINGAYKYKHADNM